MTTRCFKDCGVASGSIMKRRHKPSQDSKKDAKGRSLHQDRLDADVLKRERVAFSSKARPVFQSFDDYVKAFPKAECHRQWLTNSGRRVNLVLLPTYSRTGCLLEGGYLWASTVHWMDENEHKVFVQDGDDMVMEKFFHSEKDAVDALKELVELAPFDMKDLEAFGYEFG